MIIGVGIVGPEAMRFGKISSLLSHGEYNVRVLDEGIEAAAEFSRDEGGTSSSIRNLASSSQFLICTEATVQRIDDVLFNAEKGALKCK